MISHCYLFLAEVDLAGTTRTAVLVRMPSSLLRKIDELTRRKQRALRTTNWTRNDQIVAMLTAAVKDAEDGKERGEAAR